MSDLSRQAAADELIAMREHIDARMSVIGCTAYEMAIEALREPERKKVEIEYTEWNEEIWGASAICGNCGCTWQIANNGEDNFCPNCGCEMER